VDVMSRVSDYFCMRGVRAVHMLFGVYMEDPLPLPHAGQIEVQGHHFALCLV